MRRFFPYYRYLLRYKWAFAAALFFAALYGISSGLGFPYVLKETFPIIFGNEPDPDSPTLRFLFGENPDPGKALLFTVLLLPATILLRSISGFLNVYLTAWCGVRVLEDLRMEVFDKLQRLQVAYFQTRTRGDLVSRLLNDCNLVKDTIVEVSNSLFKEPLTFLSALTALIVLSLQHKQNMFILFCLAAVPLCILPIRYFGRKLAVKARQLQRQAGTVTERATENLGAIREIRAFSLEEREKRRFRRTVRDFLKYQLKVVKYEKALGPSIELVTGLVITLALFYAARTRLDLEVKYVVALFLALHMSYTPIKHLGSIHNKIRRGTAALDRVEEILREPILVGDPPDPQPLPEPVLGHLRFDHVDFDYGEGQILHDVDCALEAGKAYALVGRSGAGKSTFASLVLRFYDPTRGRILLDGIDLRSLALSGLRAQIALVPQDPVLFNESILENIRLSRPTATRQEIEKAAQHAHAAEFIAHMEHGYDTIVGDRGTRLSGGQKQRVAIARAFLKNSPVLILDEATSALDSESEDMIQDALADLIRGKTVLIIAHRFSTLRMADEILVFDQGRLTGKGGHAGLIQENPVYQNLYARQELG